MSGIAGEPLASPADVSGTLLRGLSDGEAARLLEVHGRNEIRREEGPGAWVLFLRQFRGPLVGLLLGASALSWLLGEAADALAIGAIVALIGAVGFLQEDRAERALAALRSMTAPQARVRRGGRSLMVPAAEVVPGDLLLLEAGDLVAADARLVEAHVLRCSEAALTGESVPVEKGVGPVAADAPLAERSDRVFLGTSVAAGTALAEVFATGMETELGRVADLLATTREEETPLQRQLERVGRTLLWLCLAVVALVAGLGLARRLAPLDVLLSSVSLAVAAVPEGLAAVVTIALAIGVQRMAARNVLVRRLAAVETLGCATVICTDKTGTLTTGRMAVRELWGPDHRALLFACAACCDAELDESCPGGTGDPTELALLRAATERGIDRRAIEEGRPRRAVHPFDAERRRMSILRADGTLYVKGAVESVLPLCPDAPPGILEANAEMGERGLRVLAVAVGRTEEERDLRLLGLVGIADPPRTEAIDAVAAARGAGIRTVMITGDHPATARASAREMGLLGAGEDPDGLVHARACPEDKIRIVRRWKDRGEVVAMTGDGVNDAPALREAHIGIAMGKTGTEVAREASDMVLADDNFASIVAAVREGRGIYENIRKALVYLLAGNASELAVMLGASAAGLPLPLLPLQLLWVNLATDGLPALALVMDPTPPDVLRRPPRRPGDPILGRAQWRQILFTGAVEAATTLGAFAWALRARDLAEARNFAFTVLVFGELFRSFAARSSTRLFWEVGAFTNLRLLGVVLVSALVQIAIHHVPLTQELFGLGALSLSDCALSLALGLVPVSVLEGAKLARRFLGRQPLP